MSYTTLANRLKRRLKELNRDRRRMAPSEYDASFPARWDVVVTLAAAFEHRDGFLGGRVAESEVTTARGTYLETAFEFGPGHDKIDLGGQARAVHPVVYTHPQHIGPGFGTAGRWRRAGRRVADHAPASHFLAERLPTRSRSGIYENVFSRAATYLAPDKLLTLSWPEGAEGFLQKLRHTPADGTTWLVLADWLDENNHSERAEDIRQYWEWKRVGIVD